MTNFPSPSCRARQGSSVLRVQLLNPPPTFCLFLPLCSFPLISRFIDNSRTKQPFSMDNTHHGTVPASSSRSAVLLDQIRQEFQNQTRASAEVEYKCASFFPSTRNIAPRSPTAFPSFIAPSLHSASVSSGRTLLSLRVYFIKYSVYFCYSLLFFNPVFMPILIQKG